MTCTDFESFKVYMGQFAVADAAAQCTGSELLAAIAHMDACEPCRLRTLAAGDAILHRPDVVRGGNLCAEKVRHARQDPEVGGEQPSVPGSRI